MSEVGLPQPSATEQVAGREVARSYAGVADEYAALHAGAIVVDRSERSRGTFVGAKSAEVLTGLVTNDVLALTPGHGLYAAALTPKGKIIADVRIFARSDDFLVDVPPRAAAGWWAMIRKFVNPRLSKYADVSAQTVDLSVYGTRARGITARALGVDEGVLDALPPYGHVSLSSPVGATVARVPDLGVEGFALVFPREERDRMLRMLLAAGATPAGTATVEVARIEAGRPEWGIEMDETTIPQEANFDELHAISYTKGCYTGQETVARVHFRGHVNRHLRGLTFAGDLAVAPRTGVADEAGKSVGEIRSVARSPRRAGIALAMIRREIAPGARVWLQLENAPAEAVVHALPLSSD